MKQEHSRKTVIFFAAMLFGAVFILALFRIIDMDLFMHLRNGEDILRTRVIPQRDIYSFTAYGEPWVNHEWLFGVSSFIIYSIGGYDLLVILKCLIIGSGFMIVYFSAVQRGADPRWAVIFCVFAAVFARFRFFARPSAVTFLFTALFFYLIVNKRKGRDKRLWALPALMIVWANMHAACVIGIALFTLYTALQLLYSFLYPSSHSLANPQNRREFFFLLLIWGACIAAVFINPNGGRLPHYIFKITGSLDVNRPREWRSITNPMRFPFLAVYVLVLYAVLILTVKKIKPFEYITTLLITAASVKYLRNIDFLAILTPAAAAVQISLLPGRTLFGKLSILNKRMVRNAAAGLAVAGLLWAAFFSGWAENRRVFQFGTGVNENIFPVDIPEFLRKHDISGRLCHNNNYGGYIMWAWPGRPKVFEDGRVEIYDKFRKQILKEGFSNILEKYGIKYALIENSFEQNAYVKYFFSGYQKWALLYYDDFKLLFVKRIPEFLDAVQKAEKRFYRPEYDFEILRPADRRRAIEWFLQEARKHPDTAYNQTALALLYRLEGEYAEAEERFSRSLEIAPGITVTRYLFADFYLKRGRPEKAMTMARSGLDREISFNASGVYLMGKIYLELDRTDQACDFLGKAVEKEPEFLAAWPYYLEALSRQNRNKQLAEARNRYDSVRRDEWLKLTEQARRMIQSKEYPGAERSFKAALNVMPEEMQGYMNLAEFYVDMEMPGSASEVLKDSFNVNPNYIPARLLFGIILRQYEPEKAKPHLEVYVESGEDLPGFPSRSQVERWL